MTSHSVDSERTGSTDRMILTGKSTETKICLSVTSFTTNPKCNFIRLNPGLLIEKQMGDRLC
jgi:hypothetical protein